MIKQSCNTTCPTNTSSKQENKQHWDEGWLLVWGHAVLGAIVCVVMLDSFIDQCLNGGDNDHEDFGVCLDSLLLVALSTQEHGVRPVLSLEGCGPVFSNADVGQDDEQ
uniref:Uncharacterized protein n=1 Tax=Craspedostauros australis TaxID=1486917 RepID=A0A7R9ZN65_9STRA|mmetsp:Transcript_23273/g.64891  ORF Transcript_23273/g.64891 Transcript_23273/m.64891 type:complete len:108 (+) Transcript_23273:33-356(+)